MSPWRRQGRRAALPAAAVLALGLLALGVLALGGVLAVGASVAAAPPDDDAVRRATLIATGVGREDHARIVRQFGGETTHAGIRAYVRAIGEALVKQTAMADRRFTFTVLNSDFIDAFARPGGDIYVTRGLLALADNEAELAAVLAHQIGHVTARHVERRANNLLRAQLALAFLGDRLDVGRVDELLRLRRLLKLQSYNAEEEFEADTLGERYLIAAGYDPDAMSRFFEKLRAAQALQTRLAGNGGGQLGVITSRLRTAEAVEHAAQIARTQVRAVARPRIGVAAYMRRIDGLFYMGDPRNGFVRGRRFIHPALRFTFTVPPGFQIVNGQKAVMAIGPGKALILFDFHERPSDISMLHYLRGVWGYSLPLMKLQRLRIGPLPGATAVARIATQDGPMDVRLVAIPYNQRLAARFLFITPPAVTQSLNLALRRTTYSFRRLTVDEVRALPALRLRTARVQPGETAWDFAARMPFASNRLARFRVLNGLTPGEKLTDGRWVKFVAE